MKTLAYRAIIEKEGKGYHGYIPSLPGCHTVGKTVEETQDNLEEALKGCIESLKAHGDLIPRDTSFEFIKTITVSDDSRLSAPI